MSEKGKQFKRLPWVAIALVVWTVGYVGGYFVLCEHDFDPSPTYPIHVRRYSHSAVRSAYWPCGWLECMIRGSAVILLSPNDYGHDWFGP